VFKDLEKDRLRYVLRVIPAIQHPVGGIENGFLVFGQQGFEGPSVARSAPLNQLCIVCLTHTYK
jgi:hypothetical protein